MNNTPATRVTFAELEKFVRDNADNVLAEMTSQYFPMTLDEIVNTFIASCRELQRFTALLEYARTTFNFSITETDVTFDIAHLDTFDFLLYSFLNDDPNENSPMFTMFFADMTDSNIDDYSNDIDPFLHVLRLYTDEK